MKIVVKKTKLLKLLQLVGGMIVTCSLLMLFQGCEKKALVATCTDGWDDGRDGQHYCTTTIGTQEWMAENLRFRQEGVFENPNAPTAQYGLLYTYKAALTACPQGWHLPTDEEWKQLEQNLGMETGVLNITGERGTNQGQQLKEESAWLGESNSNEYHFSALPLGQYNPSYGPYFQLGEQASFWTATRADSSGGVWVRVLKRQEQGITRTYYSELTGHACRCVAD